MSTRWMNSRGTMLAPSAGGNCGLKEEGRRDDCNLRSIGNVPSTAPIPRLQIRIVGINSGAKRVYKNISELKTVTKSKWSTQLDSSWQPTFMYDTPENIAARREHNFYNETEKHKKTIQYNNKNRSHTPRETA